MGLNDVNPQIEGGTDGTIIGNTGDRLKVDAISSSPTVSSKFRVVTLTTPVTLTTNTYTNVFTYSGSGKLMGFNLEFNNSAITVKLVVDGETIFDSTTISTYNSLSVTSNSAVRYQSGSGIVINASAIDFSLKDPISYSSNVTISANPGGTSRNFNQGIVYLTKET